MPRNLLISFLGTANYQPTRYYTSDSSQASEPLRFAPEATLQFHCSDFGRQDEVLIFTTTEATLKSWEDFEHVNWQTKEAQPQIGLKRKLEEANLPCSFNNIAIKDGQSTDEIWKIFKTVFDQLQEGDKVVFDITYGFRSIPMLNMVLINYAKFLKNITVRGIYYGAFEAKVKNESGEFCTPIWDLTPFAELQEWSIAAGEFIRHGKTDHLSELLTDTQPDLGQQLQKLEQSLLNCRGIGLLKETDFDGIRQTLSAIRDDTLTAQLQPLLEKMETKIESFRNGQNTLQNGYAAVAWCIQHNMIQQGITFLQETLKTYLIEKYFGESHITEYAYRALVQGALWGKNADNNREFKNKYFANLPASELDRQKAIYNEMLTFVKSKKKLKDLYVGLTNELRNDINHCGFQAPYQTADDMKTTFTNIFEKIKALNL